MCKKTTFVVLSFVGALAQARGPAAPPESVTVQELAKENSAKSAFQRLESQSAAISEEADRWRSSLNSYPAPSDNIDSFVALRDEVNDMGRLLSTLNSQRASLSPEEQHTLSAITPFAQSVAANTTGAIELFNEKRDAVDPRIYTAYAANIYRGSGKIEHTVADSLKYEKVRAEEAKLGTRLQSEGE